MDTSNPHDLPGLFRILEQKLRHVADSQALGDIPVELMIDDDGPAGTHTPEAVHDFFALVQQHLDAPAGRQMAAEIATKVVALNRSLGSKRLTEEQRIRYLLKKTTAWLQRREAAEQREAARRRTERIDAAVKHSIAAALEASGFKNPGHK